MAHRKPRWSWLCEDCREEHPEYKALWFAYKSQWFCDKCGHLCFVWNVYIPYPQPKVCGKDGVYR